LGSEPVEVSNTIPDESTRHGFSEADVPKLARLVKIVGMLLQTKIYLLWSTRVFL
jgi:hypothetical protein